jgi:hypothetical protein
VELAGAQNAAETSGKVGHRLSMVIEDGRDPKERRSLRFGGRAVRRIDTIHDVAVAGPPVQL